MNQESVEAACGIFIAAVKRSMDKWEYATDGCTCDICNAVFLKTDLGLVVGVECCDKELMLRYGCVDCKKKYTVYQIKDMAIGKSPCGKIVHTSYEKITLPI